MPKWTAAQENAIKARNRNIIVSAAAGSGKTAVLVERVIRLITDEKNPVDIDRLLIVTFTNPAAAEMKSRISARLQRILYEDKNNFNARRQLSLLPAARICTIDAFCLNIVRDNFFKLGISRDFTVLDEAEAQILSDTAANNVLDAHFEKQEKDFISLVEMLSGPKDDKSLISSIKRVYNFIYAQPFPFEWLANAIEEYNPEKSIEKCVWFGILKDYVNEGLDCAAEMAEYCISVLDENDEVYEKYYKALSSDLRVISSLRASLALGWDNAKCAFSEIKFDTIGYKKGYTPPFKEEVTQRREIYKNICRKELAGVFIATEADYVKDNIILYPLLKKIEQLIYEFESEYMRLKEEQNAYTFADIEHFALKLLLDITDDGIVRSDLAEELKNSFYEILIDEYQDTNEVQDSLFELLSNGENRFMVGDVKQSIYRFRLAMPYIFTAKKDSYSDYNADNCTSSRIILDKNFRSRKGICEYVNFVFGNFMSRRLGELDYNEAEYLNYNEGFYPDTAVTSASVKILTGTKGADFDKNEAIYIANTILKKINSKETVFDSGKIRPVEFGDFAVLLRSTKAHIAVYNEVLTSFGIPVVCDNSSNLFENNEIKILLSFLRIIDNPMQDIPLLTVMMSALYGFTADELAELKLEHNNKKCSLYTSVVNSCSPKVKSFLQELDMFRKLAATMSVSAFIRFICIQKSVFAFACALGNGEQRCRNIYKLIEFAEDFDSSQRIGLTAFIRLINKVEMSDKPLTSASLSSGAGNAVTIMSIHHSKGLEFPVVILAGSERSYNFEDLKLRPLLNNKSGLGFKLHNEEKLYQLETIPYKAVSIQNKTALMSENLRVLYVAMTRAKEQFISFVTVDNLQSKVSRLSAYYTGGKINPYLCRKIDCDGDFLLLATLLHIGGSKLAEFSEIQISPQVADFDMELQIINSVEEIEAAEQAEPVKADAEMLRIINEKVMYKYGNEAAAAIPAKINASELDNSVKSFDFFASSKPAFMNKGGLTPGERGTAMHAFMQFCDYFGAKSNLELEIKRLTEHSFISQEQADSLDRAALIKLFESSFAERIFNSDKIYREIKISSFSQINDAEDNLVLIRGISDCVFEENGALVLVDYKTDRVKTEEELLVRYTNQIAFYKEAVSKTLQKPVKEAVLYSFCLGKVCYYK